MKKLGFISLFLCCCMVINLSMAMAAEVETASDAVLSAAVEETQPDAEFPETDEELDAELLATTTTENITYPVEGGRIYFDAVNGVIKDCVADEGKEVASANIPAAIFGVLVTKIADKAFMKCSNMTSVTLPDSVTDIGKQAFSGCGQLREIHFSNNLVKIDENAFAKCTALTSVILPDSVTTLGKSAFTGCTTLNDVVLSARLTAIPETAFSDCTGLTSITIATNVTSIGLNAFANCNALNEVRYKGTLQQWLAINIMSKEKQDGNRCLIDALAADGSSFEVESPATPPVIIKSVEVYDINGNALKTIPNRQFLASVTVTGLERLEDAVVFFAAYSMDGQYQGLNYAFVQTSAGATTKVTFPMENPNGNISQLRAFAVKSISDLTPLSNPVSFP